MPTYEYVCDACAHTFDELQAFSDAPLTRCPKCKKKKLRRLFGTGAAVLFRGSGFYETDYRSDSYKAGHKAETEATKPAETKTDGTESKPTETKTDTAAKAVKTGKTKPVAKAD